MLQLRKHALECLRQESECLDMAGNVYLPHLRSHFLRMAGAWRTLALSGPSPYTGESISKTEQLKKNCTNGPLLAPSVLVVENNDLLKGLMAHLVETAGFKAIQTRNAAEAVFVLESRIDIKLLVTNVLMPGDANGVDLVHEVARRWPTIKIIVVSGQRGLSETDLPSACRFIAKPYHETELIFEIRALLAPTLTPGL
jgi:CheY-like chemotaxis protein